jgi:hypothetical protein
MIVHLREHLQTLDFVAEQMVHFVDGSQPQLRRPAFRTMFQASSDCECRKPVYPVFSLLWLLFVEAIELAVRRPGGIGHVVISTADDGFVGDGRTANKAWQDGNLERCEIRAVAAGGNVGIGRVGLRDDDTPVVVERVATTPVIGAPEVLAMLSCDEPFLGVLTMAHFDGYAHRSSHCT